MAAGPRRRRRGLCRVPARERDRLRPGASLLLRRGAADTAPSAAARRAVPDLGGSQRVARRGAEHARRRLRRHAWRHRDRRLRRPRRRRHRQDLAEVPAAHAGRFWPTCATAMPRRGRTVGREVDPRGDGAGDAALDEAEVGRAGHRPDPNAVLKMAERMIREGPSARARSPPTSVPRTPAACSRRGSPGSASTPAAAISSTCCRPTASPRRPLSPRPPPPRAAPARRRRRGVEAFSSGDLGSAATGVFEALVPAFPYAPSIAFLGAEKAKLREPRRGDRRRVALIADGIGSMHGVTTRSSRSASAASPASTST